jgi:hypothetical protein
MAGSEVEMTVPSMFSMNRAVAMMKAVRNGGAHGRLSGRGVVAPRRCRRKAKA